MCVTAEQPRSQALLSVCTARQQAARHQESNSATTVSLVRRVMGQQAPRRCAHAATEDQRGLAGATCQG